LNDVLFEKRRMLVLRLWKAAFTFYMVFCKSVLSERKRERETA